MSLRAFGVDLGGDVELPAAGAPDPAAGPALRCVRVARAQIARDWTGSWTHVARARAGGRTYGRIVRNDAGDLLFRAQGSGLFELRADLTRLRYAPVQDPKVPWARYLVAQVLPFAALLAGREVLHAGAVEAGGGAVAVTAPSTGGKSTLLGALVQAGCPLVADDVVAFERSGDELVVHPGPGLLSLRDTATEALGGAEAVAALGPTVETAAGSSWRAVRRHAEPLPLRALVLLERRPEHAEVRIERLERPDPRILLGSTFNAAWQERGRMLRLLDLTAFLAARVPVLALSAPLEASPAQLAEDVQRATA